MSGTTEAVSDDHSDDTEPPNLKPRTLNFKP